MLKSPQSFVFRTTFWQLIEPVVGDYCEHFSNQGFFDSLVRWQVGITVFEAPITT